MTEVLWEPSPREQTESLMACFATRMRDTGERVGAGYEDLWEWSTTHPDRFWPALAQSFKVRFETPWSGVLDGPMPLTRWFPGATLSYAAHLLDRPRPDGLAIIFRNETGTRVTMTDGELRAAVGALARDLAEAGVGMGDRVAAYLPNHPAAVVALLAASSLGAVFSSASPDFGVEGVLDRFGQIEPKALIAIDGYLYAGRRHDVRDRVRAIAGRLPSLRRTIVVPYLGEAADLGGLRNLDDYRDLLRAPPVDPTCRALPFDHPLYILYSSGTTGKPKCMIHRQGGVLLQHLKEQGLHTDIRAGDRVFYYTTTGWMMWNWLVSALALGATLVLYDGSPTHPTPRTLLEMADEEGIRIFGTSARYLLALEKSGVRSGGRARLETVTTILSTGSPLAPEQFDYVYRDLKSDVRLSSISGGTDIVSCFALGNPTVPVRRGEIQSRGLGMRVAIYDQDGRPVVDEAGELVCTRPFPTMPLGFWNDPGGGRYRAAYFERFEGVWCHGDTARLTPSGGIVIYGRSDTVLNPGGVRIGTAEIYRQVERFAEIVEAVAVGQPFEGSERILLFVVLRPGTTLDPELEHRIRERIREELSPRHVPARILPVPDIPKTRSGKISEMAVRQVIRGERVTNVEALANPEALSAFSIDT